jgi:transcriptional regulator with XRE-family HTH domain
MNKKELAQKTFERFEQLLKMNNTTIYRVSKDTKIADGSLYEWKKGKYTPKHDKLQKISDYFGVSLDYFYDTPSHSDDNVKKTIETDVETIIENLKKTLTKGNALTLNGKPISEKQIETMSIAIEIGLELAKKANK